MPQMPGGALPYGVGGYGGYQQMAVSPYHYHCAPFGNVQANISLHLDGQQHFTSSCAQPGMQMMQVSNRHPEGQHAPIAHVASGAQSLCQVREHGEGLST